MDEEKRKEEIKEEAINLICMFYNQLGTAEYESMISDVSHIIGKPDALKLPSERVIIKILDQLRTISLDQVDFEEKVNRRLRCLEIKDRYQI